eukprot:scaffold781_cov394-Prasinococcus_capsulatus_cf.AAC.26
MAHLVPPGATSSRSHLEPWYQAACAPRAALVSVVGAKPGGRRERAVQRVGRDSEPCPHGRARRNGHAAV